MKIEIRNNTATLSGYVNAVERESRVLHDANGEFIEKIKAGTFAKALEKNEVRLFYNHQRCLTPIKFELEEDQIGLKCTCTIDDTEVLSKIDELRGWSFGMKVLKDSWDNRDDGMRMRTIEDIELDEVSILSVTPAYIATTIEKRSLEDENIEVDKSAEKAYNKLKLLRQKTDFILSVKEQINEKVN